jgi:hypothetical protein
MDYQEPWPIDLVLFPDEIDWKGMDGGDLSFHAQQGSEDAKAEIKRRHDTEGMDLE